VLSQDKQRYGVTLRAEPDHKLLGIRLKNDAKTVAQQIKTLSDGEIQTQVKRGWFEVGGHRLELNEVRVIYQFGGETSDGGDLEAHSDNDVLVLLNMKPNQELVDEGVAREVINRIQKLKKKAKLIPTDPVIVTYTCSKVDSEVTRVVKSHQAFIEGVIKSKFVQHDAEAEKREILLEETQEFKDIQLRLRITSLKERVLPNLPWVNLVLADDVQMRYVAPNARRTATFNLVDFNGKLMTLDQLKKEVERVFGIVQTKWTITGSLEKRNALDKVTKEIAGKTLFILKGSNGIIAPEVVVGSSAPFSKFVNKKTAGGDNVTVYIENPSQA